MFVKAHFDRGLMTILLLAFMGAALTACKDKTEVVEQIRAIKTFTVAEQATGQIRKFSGIVRATDSSSLSFEVSGRVETVHVDIGDRVKKGDVLAVLDKEPYQLDLESAQAELVKARAGVVNAKEDFERQQRVFAQGAGAQSKLDKAKYNMDAAQSQVSFQMTKVNLAKRNLGKTSLTSPYNGYVASRSINPHEEIAVGEQVFVVDAEGNLQVGLAVPETTINRINTDTQATVRFPNLPDRSVEGRISYIGSAARESNAFPVKVDLLGSIVNVSPGMTAEVALAIKDDTQQAGFLIPVQAILPDKDPGQGYVFVFDPQTSTVKKNKIQTLGQERNMVVVIEGLSVGDIIASAGVSFLADGMKVKLMAP
jgi:RND family efflux transporter MFP subunit